MAGGLPVAVPRCAVFGLKAPPVACLGTKSIALPALRPFCRSGASDASMQRCDLPGLCSGALALCSVAVLRFASTVNSGSCDAKDESDASPPQRGPAEGVADVHSGDRQHDFPDTSNTSHCYPSFLRVLDSGEASALCWRGAHPSSQLPLTFQRC